MKENLNDYRKTYQKGELSMRSVDPNPMQQFRTWFYQVRDSGDVDEVNAMTLSTLDKDGFPRGRVVLLKKYDEYGFYFYTNYESQKGRAIEAYNQVCLSFFWPVMERQVIIKGYAERTSAIDSDNYFGSRPRGSQLSAMVSDQSNMVEGRDVLEKRLRSLEEQYKGLDIPRPKNWGGYLVSPVEFEFWQGRPNRLHDRIRYQLDGYDWKLTRLQP